ncbi:MAG: hypothetical protein IJ315_06185 [Firmicutes bacterium]|nr:hypothetical protein [Bacillota bacterium]
MQDLEQYSNPRLDKACKEVLKNTPFLVRILKECVPEYAECTLEEIETYITGTRVGEQKSKIVGDSESIYGRHVDLRFDVLCTALFDGDQRDFLWSVVVGSSGRS